MKRSTVPALIAILAFAAGAAGAQTPIKKGQPAFTVMLNKNEVYSVDEFNAALARIEKAYTSRLDPSMSAADKDKARVEVMAAMKPKLLDALIQAVIFKQFCDREGITVADADVNAAVTRLKAQVGLSADADLVLEQAIALSQGIVLDLRTYTRQRLLLKRYIQTKRADDLKAIRPPAPDDIIKRYDKMKEARQLDIPETARISLVFIDIKGKSGDEKKKALETMRALELKIKEDRNYFDKLLLASFDPSSGYMAKSSYTLANLKEPGAGHDPRLVAAVFKLKPGEISGLLENDEGYQIVRLIETSPAKQLGLYDAVPGANNVSVQDLIAEQLYSEAQEAFAIKMQAEILEKIKGEAAVTIMKDNLKGVVGDAELEAIAVRYAKKK